MTLLLAAALLSSTLIGFLAARIFLPAYKPAWADLTLKICLGVGVGIGITSCEFFLTRLLIGPSRIACIAAEVVLMGAAGLAAWFARDAWAVDRPHAKPAGWSWLLLAALLGSLAMAVILFADSSAGNPYGAWDAWSIWNLRARFLAQPDASWRRAFSPALNHIAGGGARHPEYPMLLSGYIARCWALMGSIGDVAAPIATAALFSGATLGLVVSALAILRGWSTAMIGGLILLATAGFLADGPWQYADVPLAFYYLAAFASLFLADTESERRGRVVVLAGLAMGLAAWTKDEGLLFALVMSLAFVGYVVMAGNSGRWRTLRGFAAGAAAPVAIVLLFRFFLAPPIATPVSVGAATHQLAEGGRYWQIAKAFWNEGAALGSGIAHPLISLFVLAACLGIHSERRRQPVAIASSIAWLAMFAAYFFAYVITPMDLTWHLGTSLGRLYVQLWPSFIFLSLAALRTAEETAIKVPLPKQVSVSAKKAKKR
jgi:hypothetical protein